MFEIDGIVIKTTQFNDNDLMVNVITNSGLVSFLAKGVMKIDSKNSSSLQILSKSHFQITSGKKGYCLRTGVLINPILNGINDFSFLAVINYVSELVYKTIITNDDATSIYPFLEKTQLFLSKNTHPLTDLLFFISQIMKCIGIGLNVDKCQNCGKTSQIVGVSYLDGGFICENCFDRLNAVKYYADELKILRYIFKTDLEHYEEVEFDKECCLKLIFDLTKFIENLTGVKISSKKLLKI